MASVDRQLISIYLLTATLMVSYGAIFSLLAEIRDSFGLTSAGIGFVGAAAFASGFVAQLFLSRFADSGYGSLMIQTGLVICIASTCWMAVADSLPEWILSRAALGFGSGIVRPAIRRYIVIRDPASAGRSLGVLTAYETAGFLVGPVIAAILNSTLGLTANFIVLAILLLIFTPFVFKIDIPSAPRPPGQGILLELIKRPAMQSCIAMGIAFWITIGVFEAIWAVYMSDLGASQVFIGLTMSLFGIPMIFISPKAGEFAQKKGSLNVAVVSIGIAICCMISYGILQHIWLLCIPLLIHAIADAFTMPATQLAVTQASGEDALASGQGLYGAVSMAVGAVTAAVGGILYQEGGAGSVWWTSGAAMIFFMMIAWWRGKELR
ncbi:MAG: MFS transporter [Pseudomonadales bacterium]|nr:MFS transporter [Pseudomonadales bacterium]MBO6701429.1 MFS transporter [Pseudomonadales bacterium]MBO7005658.1 MFS transporter [Pseudomonadales bacterium]